MTSLRMTSDLRRQLILGAAKRCFARNGFAGTTTKSVAAAAAISEGLLVQHFPAQDRRGARRYIRRAAVQAFPVQGGALRRDFGRGVRGRPGSGASFKPKTI